MIFGMINYYCHWAALHHFRNREPSEIREPRTSIIIEKTRFSLGRMAILYSQFPLRTRWNVQINNDTDAPISGGTFLARSNCWNTLSYITSGEAVNYIRSGGALKLWRAR